MRTATTLRSLLITTAALGVWTTASPASAATQLAVDQFVNSNLTNIKSQFSAGAQHLSGSAATDLGHATPGVTNSYSLGASASKLSINNKYAAQRYPEFNVSFQESKLSAGFQDSLVLKDSKPGQTLALHRTLTMTGGVSFNGSAKTGSEALGIYALQLRASGVNIDPGPYAAFNGAGPGFESGSAFATGYHSIIFGSSPISLDRIQPTSIDYSIYLAPGSTQLINFTLSLSSQIATINDGLASLSEDFSINFDTGGSYFTIVDESGIDTGVRYDPRLDRGFKLTSGSGFNYLAAVGQGGGAVPEPASWALMLVGFGGLGAVLRRRRTGVATA